MTTEQSIDDSGHADSCVSSLRRERERMKKRRRTGLYIGKENGERRTERKTIVSL